MSDNKDTPKGRVLTIAGSDSGGGAGIQADTKTITCLGGYAATAVTAITVQNTQGVSGVIPLNPLTVKAQAIAVLSDIGADVIKTGMLGDKHMVETIAQLLADHAARLPHVVDPVMVASSGDSLLPRDAVEAVRTLMIKGAIITPNAPEAGVLTNREVHNLDGQRRAADRLLEAGAAAAIVKGGHVEGDVIVDVIATPDGETFIEHERIKSANTHGTGCTLASALACGLAQGLTLEAAFRRAQVYVAEAIRRAPGLGGGHGPLAHGWPLTDPDAAERLLRR